MLRLWLLRHAKSAWDDPGLDDFARPLSPRGKKACRHMARHMAERGIHPDFVLCSPATRTRQTWERLEKRLQPVTAGAEDDSDRPRVRFEPSLYLAEPPALFAIIRAAPKRCRELLLIGHNPGLEEFAQRLTGSAAGDALPRLTGKFPTAGLAELTFPVTTWAEITPESGFLASFVVPAQLGE
ncbi:SixA phosphatase family protein [Ferrovibrio xuzhouensis]|uniref:SixA phosphatase family protein n=1 Tax=Ferrovibrio xuzhouensis TaxID=1576914 RepID=A0ABV7VHD2_9PROT